METEHVYAIVHSNHKKERKRDGTHQTQKKREREMVHTKHKKERDDTHQSQKMREEEMETDYATLLTKKRERERKTY